MGGGANTRRQPVLGIPAAGFGGAGGDAGGDLCGKVGELGPAVGEGYDAALRV
jgi:hypothetical protein